MIESRTPKYSSIRSWFSSKAGAGLLLASLLGLLASPLGAQISYAETYQFTPQPGSPDRTAIMDAIRFVTRSSVTFKVNQLLVLEKPGKASAFADVADSSGKSEIGGIFLLSKRGGRWVALAMVGGGGGTDECSRVRPILRTFVSEVQSFDASLGALPSGFAGVLNEALGTERDTDCAPAEVYDYGNLANSGDVAQSNTGRLLHYVDGTQPPDAWLALRTLPGDAGGRIAQLPNGTLLEVLERRTDNWWRVRVVEMGQEGWLLYRSGSRTWVSCCKLVR